jgi:hypothetical protein
MTTLHDDAKWLLKCLDHHWVGSFDTWHFSTKSAMRLRAIADRLGSLSTEVAELRGAAKAAYRDLACVQLCLLQNDREGALEILRSYGRIDFSDGPQFLEGGSMTKHSANGDAAYLRAEAKEIAATAEPDSCNWHAAKRYRAIADRIDSLRDACEFAVDWLTSYNLPPQVTANERDEVLTVLYRALIQRGERSETAEAIAATLSEAARAALERETT